MSVDLTLPETSSPAIDPYKDLPDELLPFALYVHIELNGDDDLTQIEEACNSQIDGTDTIRRAPRYNFSGQPLRAAFDEHLENLIETRRFGPFYFIAVVEKEWRDNGLVIVTMDDGSDDDVGHVDHLRVPTNEVGLVLVNLQLANVDWSEYKDQYGSDDDSEDDDHDDHESSSHITPRESAQSTQPSGTSKDEDYSDGASEQPPNIGYWIGLYAIPGIDFEAVMRALHPSWGPPVPYSELICRAEGRVPADNQQEAVAHAKRLHPQRCRGNPLLYRNMFLVIDTVNYEEEGVLVVKLDWDEKMVDNKDKTLSELEAAGQKAETDTQRLPFINSDTITMFNEFKAGYRPWKQSHKTFLAYAGPKTRYPSAYLAAVDKSFMRRKSGTNRFIEKNVQFPLTTDGDVIEDAEKGFQAALNQHAGFVREERFCSTLCPGFFVYCDEELVAKDTSKSVVLVKVDENAGWSTMECKAGSVYQTLCDLVEQKRDWEGQKTMSV